MVGGGGSHDGEQEGVDAVLRSFRGYCTGESTSEGGGARKGGKTLEGANGEEERRIEEAKGGRGEKERRGKRGKGRDGQRG